MIVMAQDLLCMPILEQMKNKVLFSDGRLERVKVEDGEDYGYLSDSDSGTEISLSDITNSSDSSDDSDEDSRRQNKKKKKRKQKMTAQGDPLVPGSQALARLAQKSMKDILQDITQLHPEIFYNIKDMV